MNDVPRNSIGDRAGPTPPFESYPYVVTLVTKQMYHFSLLPKTLGSLDVNGRPVEKLCDAFAFRGWWLGTDEISARGCRTSPDRLVLAEGD